MVTYNQLCIRKLHLTKFRKCSRARSLSRARAPLKEGVVLKTKYVKPKKPNSANRRIAKVRLTTRKTVNCYIPGLGHNLREFSLVVAEGGGPKDLNGIQYNLLRGRLDFGWRERDGIERQNKLTRRGVPKFEKRDEF